MVLNLPFRPSRTFVDDADAVMAHECFGECLVNCYVTRAALETYFGAAAGGDGERLACLQAFDRHADTIGAMLASLVERSGSGVRAVVLTVDEVYRALTRKNEAGRCLVADQAA